MPKLTTINVYSSKITHAADFRWFYNETINLLDNPWHCGVVQYIPRNMHTVFALLYFVVVKHWLIFPYPSGLLHWHCGNLTIAPVPAKQPWWIWINTSCESIMNDCITTTKQSTTKPCAYFLGYTVLSWMGGETMETRHIEGILPKRPYLLCVSMAGRALFGRIPSIFRATPVCLPGVANAKMSKFDKLRDQN